MADILQGKGFGMSLRLRIILIVLGVIIILLALFVRSKSQDVSFQLHWDYYPAYGDSDVVKLRAYEINNDTSNWPVPSVINVLSDSINIQWNTHQFKVNDDGKIHFFVMTAVDSSDNESGYSNIAVLDLTKPEAVRNVNITR